MKLSIPLLIAILFIVAFIFYADNTRVGTKSIGPKFGFINKNQQAPSSEESPFAQLAKQQVRVPILMYHYVEYNQNKADYLRDSLNIPPHIFEQQIITLKDAGYTIVTPSEVFDSHNTIAKPVILSFDDGYRDFYTDVFPILKRHNAKAVSYLVVNFIDAPNYMSSAQIKEIADSGLVEFGSHTVNHKWLKDSDHEAVVYELTESKKVLESMIGKKVVSIAYPYGAYDTKVIELTNLAGYSNAVTTDQGISRILDNRHTLMRIRPGYNVGTDLVSILEK